MIVADWDIIVSLRGDSDGYEGLIDASSDATAIFFICWVMEVMWLRQTEPSFLNRMKWKI